MKKYFTIHKKTIIAFFVFILFFSFNFSCYAGMLSEIKKNIVNDNIEKTNNAAGYDSGVDEYSLSKFLGKAVKATLSLLGVIFIILILYAGYNWMTAAGDESKVQKAKDTIQRAIIGLIITVMAYGIWNFVYSFLI